MMASYGAPLALIKQLCEIGGKPLIMTTYYNNGYTALHFACKSYDPNIDIVKCLVQNG